MTTYSIGNLITGRELVEVNVLSGPWSDTLRQAETLSVELDMNDQDLQALGLRSAASPGQAFLAVEENGTCVAAGPIWTRAYSRETRRLTLGAGGMGSYFNHRLILPVLAASLAVGNWTIPDPADATQTIPNPALSTIFAGVSPGQICKLLVQQARTWTGGNVPVVFQADEAGSAGHTYLGTDFKPVWEAINDIMNDVNGVEVNFLPRRTSDGKGFEWLLQTGTIAQPLITSTSVLQWNVTVPESPVTGLSTNEDATKLGSLAWGVGGAQTNVAMVSRAYDPTLINATYPLFELLDSAHPDVSLQSTLDGYTMADVLAGKNASETWSFTVKAYAKDSSNNKSAPWIGEYSVGDFFDLILDTWDPVTGIGDPYLPGDTYKMRIIGISGDEKGEDIRITCAPRIPH